MKRNEIDLIFSQKAQELLNQGFQIYTPTMSGSQGAIAQLDFVKGSEIHRLVMEEATYNNEDWTVYFDTLRIKFGKASELTAYLQSYRQTVWNDRLELSFQIEFAKVKNDWYTTLEEGIASFEIHKERFHNKFKSSTLEMTDERLKIAHRWLRKQPKMKTCTQDCIEKIRKERQHNRVNYIITAKGKDFALTASN